jgi:hypothetical protein
MLVDVATERAGAARRWLGGDASRESLAPLWRLSGPAGGELLPGKGVVLTRDSEERAITITATATGGGGGTYGYGVADRATLFAGFGSPILPGADFGTRHIVLRSSRPTALYAYLSEPPASGDSVFDVEMSPDEGASWGSILASPVVIPAGFKGPTINTSFSVNAGLAAVNLLRLHVISAGDGPGFSNGFSCNIQLAGDTIPGWDRATFAFGFTSNAPIGRDLGAYYVATRKSKPGTIYCNVKNPPATDAYLDIQLFQGDEWTSIFLSPLLIPGGNTSVIAASAFAEVAIAPGDLLRPMLVSGPMLSGMGYNVSLELEVTG